MVMDLNALVRNNKSLLQGCEQELGYRFTDLRLLQRALVHASFAFEHSRVGSNNETLEFLGDAVLDLVVGHLLYRKYRTMREGELTRLRAALVNETHLAEVARTLDLGRFLFLGKGEDASQGRTKASILSCAFEAVVGAIFEDAGYEATADIVARLFVPTIEEKKKQLLVADAKSRLQEKLQERYSQGPSYRLDKEEGPDHNKRFTFSVLFQDEVLGSGSAGSKKEAEQRAAAAALEYLQTKNG